MKTKFILLLLPAFFSLKAKAQVQCAGNGDFSTAIFIDPATFNGCQNGGSCSGATVLYDTRPSCDAREALDACAPAPATAEANGFDIWFKFYAVSTNAVIVVNPGISLSPAIQVFSGNACGNLTEIALAVGGGNNVTTTANLTGLVPDGLYYFRVFGTASNYSQRHGDICFCGTTGVSNTTLALPINLTRFTAGLQNKNVNLIWSISPDSDAKTFEIQRSTDARNFTTIQTITASGINYNFTDIAPPTGKIILYRLRSTSLNGHVEISKTIPVNISGKTSLSIYPTLVNTSFLDVESGEKVIVSIINSLGKIMVKQSLAVGHNNVNVSVLSNGVYFLQNTANGEIQKFVVSK